MVQEEHSENLRELLNDLVEQGDIERAVALLATRHAADQADMIEDLDEDAQHVIVRGMSIDQLADVVEYMDEEVRARLLEDLPAEALVPILNRVDENIATDIVQDMPPEQAEIIVPLLEDSDEITELLTYPEESAGGRMSTDVVALRREWTVEESIWFLRRQQPDADRPFYLYVVDARRHLLGVVSPRALITSAPYVPIGQLMTPNVISVRVDEDQEVAAERMRHYSLVAIPVVDEEGRLRGVITADDILDVQVEEATEDIYHLAGLSEEERIFRPVREALRPRLGWLLFNLSTAFIAAFVVSLFEGTIEQVALLAVFMPMVAGMAGNAGLQTLTLVVRSIALGEIEPRDARRVLAHEIVIAVINGIVIGALVGVVAYIWHGNAWLGLIVSFALLANIANAMMIGVLVPMLLRRLSVDPALASGVIVMVSDAVGFFILLGLATLLISRLT